MKEVEFHEVTKWGWECPECSQWNEEDDDPGFQETVICQNSECGEEFKPVEGS